MDIYIFKLKQIKWCQLFMRNIWHFYLYIPTHLVHSPGVLADLMVGNTLPIHQLCNNEAGIEIIWVISSNDS